jgi:SnoaL-like domain
MELIDEYLAALEVGDAERVFALFAPDGIVHSPLYGSVPARQFYPTLFADTAEAKLTLRRVFRDDREAVAFWFELRLGTRRRYAGSIHSRRHRRAD